MIIEKRYNGPVDSGNGGWTAGLIATLVDDPAGVVVTLRVPPPMEIPLSVEREDRIIRVYGPEHALVAEGSPTTLEPRPIAPVPFAEAVAVSANYPGFAAHPFPTCFVCGPRREPGDGMRLFPGRLPDGRTATPWHVPDDVSTAMVWASLDCPGGWSIGIEARPYVLGRVAVRVDALPEPGDECVVMGRLLDIEGRKASVATSLYGSDGRAIAYSRATWIAIA